VETERVTTPPGLLVLHGVRLTGFGSADRVAARFGLDPALVEELLEDHRALGLVTWTAFGDTEGWSLTDRGRLEGERRLAAELDATGRRDLVRRTHLDFLDLNARLLRAVTDWQTRPVVGDPFAANDHQDLRWDRRVLATLGELGSLLRPTLAPLSAALPRFTGYDDRYAAALARAEAGQSVWIDGIGIDSCHTVWFQLHEDLIATLGIARGHEPG
jgi:hypothetical protein